MSFSENEDLSALTPDELAWYVAHTRPRCEKKLAEYCIREGFSVTLPLYKSVKKYQRKTAVFEKPLFPNYVFLRLHPRQRKKVYQSDYVANLLDVPDQKTFQEQLDDILLALETDYEICALPHITAGKRVKITAGALRGMEGYVEERQGRCIVLLRLDFIAQAAGVKVDAADLEIID
ncbi:MAG TPA: transcription termination/antitermination NusG family protein [Verrucomicrobiae bacterium]|jgi:transcription antitermination factor NusG|nr:transcription termination/antitermination NusG family protein [Verrucomicrobiae bacterium]